MNPGKIQVASSRGIFVIKLSGDVRLNLCSALEQYVDDMFASENFKTVLVDLTDAEGVDSTTLGQLAKISIISRENYGLVPSIITPREDITRILMSMGFDKVFYLIGELPTHISELDELHCEDDVCEDAMKAKVLEAHKILMGMNEQNRATFKELVDTLEKNRYSILFGGCCENSKSGRHWGREFWYCDSQYLGIKWPANMAVDEKLRSRRDHQRKARKYTVLAWGHTQRAANCVN